MKKFNRMQLFLAALLFSSFSFSQSFTPGAWYGGPGNNSCDAITIWCDQYGLEQGHIYFPVPAGLKVSGLNMLSTEYTDLYYNTPVDGKMASFIAIVQSSCGTIEVQFPLAWAFTNGTTWRNSGNVASASSNVIVSGCITNQVITYSTFQANYGNDPIAEMYLVCDQSAIDWNQLSVDNTNINGTIFNYDDCDENYVADDFECANNLNEKMQICHYGQTICISRSAAAYHQAHGDILGACFEVSSRAATRITEPTNIKDYSISCYPNPIGKLTKIQFTLPANASVSIKVYDMTGREVSQLFKGEKAAGIHILDYNSSALGTGIYYCRMLATSGDKGFVITCKMVKLE